MTKESKASTEQRVVDDTMTSRPESDQQFTKTLQDDLLIIDTPALQPAYGMRPLSKEGLSVVVKGPAPSQMNTYALR